MFYLIYRFLLVLFLLNSSVSLGSLFYFNLKKKNSYSKASTGIVVKYLVLTTGVRICITSCISIPNWRSSSSRVRIVTNSVLLLLPTAEKKSICVYMKHFYHFTILNTFPQNIHTPTLNKLLKSALNSSHNIVTLLYRVSKLYRLNLRR